MTTDYRPIWEEMTRQLYAEGGHYETFHLVGMSNNQLTYRFGAPLTLEEALQKPASVRIVFPSKLPTSGV